jgi:outer membrane protein TolC
LQIGDCGLRIACLIGLTCLTGLTSEDPTPLVAAHLRQAAAITPAESAMPGADEQLAKLKADIAVKEKMWTERLAQPVAADGLLKGLPESVLTQAQASAGDAEKTRAVLRQGVTLELLLALAAVRSPDVRASHQNWRAAVRRFDQASYLEDLMVQYRAFARELDTKVGPQKHKEMPGKTFAFPSALTLKGQMVDVGAELARLEYQTKLRQQLNAMARAFFDAQYLTRAVRIARENRELVAQMVEFASARLRVAGGTQADALKAQSMLALLDNKIRTIEKRQATVWDRIASMLNLKGFNGHDLEEADLSLPAIDEKEALGRASTGKQEWQAAKARLEQMRLMVRLAETMVLPRGSVGLSQLAPSVGAEAGPTRKASAAFPARPMVDLQRAGFGANAAWIDELRVRTRQAEEALTATSAQSRFAVEQALSTVKIARDDLSVYRDDVEPRARQALQSTSDRYNKALIPFVEYLDAMRSVLDADLECERARRDLNLSLTGLSDSMGRTAADLLHNQPVKRVPVAGSVWTCPMHPQIRVAKPGKCPICAMALTEEKREE